MTPLQKTESIVPTPRHPSRLYIALAGGFMTAALLFGCDEKLPVADTAPSSASTKTMLAHAHATPGETCFIEDPSKREPGRLWCKEHGRYEDRCWKCQPQLRDSKRPYCDEHGLYEDECFLCDPSRDGAKSKPAKPASDGVSQ